MYIDVNSIQVNINAQKLIDELEYRLKETFNVLGVPLTDNLFYVFTYPYINGEESKAFFTIGEVAKYIVIRRNTLDPLYNFMIMDKEGHSILTTKD